METLKTLFQKFLSWSKTLPFVLRALVIACALVIAAIVLLSSCGATTKAIIKNNATDTSTTVTITTNNPTDIQTPTDADVNLNPLQ